MVLAADGGQANSCTRYMIENNWALQAYVYLLRVRDAIGFLDWSLNKWFEQFI
jgi:hypothetical protein